MSAGLEPKENPKAYILGGVPGTGKSGLVKMAKEELRGNAISIDIDELRDMHPRKAELYKEHGDDWAGKANDFADALAARVFESAVENKYNIIREGTLKSSAGALKQLNELKEKTIRLIC